jgi:hypothetical protein
MQLHPVGTQRGIGGQPEGASGRIAEVGIVDQYQGALADAAVVAEVELRLQHRVCRDGHVSVLIDHTLGASRRTMKVENTVAYRPRRSGRQSINRPVEREVGRDNGDTEIAIQNQICS